MPELTSVPKFLFDVQLVDSKMTTLHDVSAACSDVHHISVKTTLNSVPLIHLGGP
jgi:hypothetical protein